MRIISKLFFIDSSLLHLYEVFRFDFFKPIIDELGDFDDALDRAAELGNVPRRLMYVRPPRNFRQRMFGQFTAWAMEGLVEEMGAPGTRQLWYL